MRAMKIHNLKIQSDYASAKLNGIKPFEIRQNDRDFKVGDLVRYNCIDDVNLNNKIRDKIYQIVYITSYEQKNGYVVFTDKEVEE